MLKRIKKIHNVGKFKRCNSGPVAFNKITFIYGRNSYGKTTLGDIFSSLQTGESETIMRRRSIPFDEGNQSIEFSFEGFDQKETSVSFEGDSWRGSLPNDLSLRVFDDGFYHRNLFSSRAFTRQTKEAFSSFVLGEKGVAKANLIADKNKFLGECNRQRKQMHATSFSGIRIPVEDFIAFRVTHTAADLESLIEAETKALSDQLDRLRNRNEIVHRKEHASIFWAENIEQVIARWNSVIVRSLQSHHKEAEKLVSEHIRQNVSYNRGAEKWLRDGLYHQNEMQNCAFCGQGLSDQAKELLQAYTTAFDDEYKKQEDEVQHVLQKCFDDLSEISDDQRILIAIASMEAVMQSYPELLRREDLTEHYRVVTESSRTLSELVTEWQRERKAVLEKMTHGQKEKFFRPHVELPVIDAQSFIELNHKVLQCLDVLQHHKNSLNEAYRNFKEDSEEHSMQTAVDATRYKLADYTLQLERLKRESICAEFLQLKEQISSVQTEVKILEEELREEQSLYLERFFRLINEYFGKFGSKDFALEKGASSQGHAPIYYLKVKFRGVEVHERDLDKIFSESDRRALALAVFWAGLSGDIQEDQLKTVVILDDPVTSFDNHRTITISSEIVKLSERVRQIIVLSHFQHGIASFLRTYANNKPVVLLEITAAEAYSQIESADIESFLRSEHEQVREGLFDFVSHKTNQHGQTDLRVFFEIELATRFAKQLSGTQIPNFSDRIDYLHAKGFISKQLRDDCHGWREILNPVHHVWMGNDIEDCRNTVDSFISFLYHEIMPTPRLS